MTEPLTATLHYLKRGPEKPVRYVFDPPPGVPQWNGIDDPRRIAIADARGRAGEFAPDRNGFQLVRAPSRVADFYAPEEVGRVYYPEVGRLLRDTLGATKVKIFGHTVRNAARPGASEPSRCVHNDHTITSAQRRVRDHLGAEAPELLKHRFGIVNVWRPIRVHDSANDGRARLSFHTSFENPLAPAAPPRESIEVRTLIFYD